MRRTRTAGIAIAALTLFAAGCRDDPAVQPILTPSFAPTGATGAGATGNSGVAIEPSGSAPPSGSPGVTGAVDTGSASVNTSGAIVTSVSYASLTSPAIWTTPPGGIALTWDGPGRQTLGLSGASFSAQRPTSTELDLRFSVRGPDGVVTFDSSTGECLVTISPALPDQMAGTFLCSKVSSADGAVQVDAQGSFSAE
jgi:hypothetical protein